jgi:flotillin
MDFVTENFPILAVLGLVAVLFIVIVSIVKRYKVAGPNEAFIITGRRGKTSGDLSGQKVVTGGGVFIFPFVQQLHILDLSSRRNPVAIRGAVSKQGIKLNVDAIAIVKVGGDEDSIRAAAQRFLTQQPEIDVFTTEVLAGALRSIVGTLTVEEIIRDRASFAAQVAEVTESALTGQGLVLDTFQIQDVTDDGTYLTDLGRPEAARLKQDAEVAEAQARRTAEQQRLAAEQLILESQRQYALQEAGIKAETDAASANAAAAGPLAEAAKQQEVLAEQEKVAVARAALTDKELDTQVRKPADAERYRVEQEALGRKSASISDAEGRRTAQIEAAQAKAEEDRLVGEGERSRRAALAEAEAIEGAKRGEAERSRRAAIAEAVRLEGDAEASAVMATGLAEAEAMTKKADAFAQYNDAAVLQMLIQVLPEVAEKLAAPMGAIDQLTVISTDGASALPRQVTSNFTQLQQLLKDTVGIDLASIVNSRAGTAANGGSDDPAS